jgi:hypothetical protein
MPVHLSVEQRGVTTELPPAIQLVFLSFGGIIQMALALAAEAGVADFLPMVHAPSRSSRSLHGQHRLTGGRFTVYSAC